MESLQNYRNLVARVDELCRRITTEFGAQLACREGCAGCCRHLSLFPVEAAALAAALGNLSAGEAAHIRRLARAATSSEACPLLEGDRCLLYAARPVICRTHGFPILAGPEGERRLDFCPENFREVTSFPAGTIIDLDLLNATLAAINAVFLTTRADTGHSGKDRFTIAEALLLEA